MRSLYKILTALLFAFIIHSPLQATDLDDNYGLGVLNINSQSIIQSLRLTLPMVVPQSIKSGWGVHASNTWTNVWAETSDYLLDYEMVEYSAGISYGTEKNLSYRVELVARRYIGGGMDSLIQNAHDLEGIGQNGRDEYARNRSVITVYNPDGSSQTIDASVQDNTGVSLLVNYDLVGTRYFPSINLFGVFRYNIESADFLTNLDDIDGCIGLGISKRLTDKLFFHSVFGYSFFNDKVNTEENSLQFHKSQRSFFVAFAWNLNPGLAVVVQYLYGEAMVKNISGLNEPSHEVHLGIKKQLSKKLFMDFSLIENTINMDNSPDFGFHMGFSFYL